MDLSRMLANAFEYYQYDRVNIQLESPGGKASSLESLMRVISKWERAKKEVTIRSEFQCASAAALLLSLSHWGQRRVDRGTTLIYHFVRIDSSIKNLTATQAEGVAHALENMDQQMLSRLLIRLQTNADGPQGLLSTIRQRLAFLDQHWSWIDEQMPTSMFSKKAGVNRPPWHKALGVFCKEGLKTDRAMSLYEKHLFQRFRLDTPMDLREAYVLCLIDQIDDLIGPKGAFFAPLEREQIDTHCPATLDTNADAKINVHGDGDAEQDSPLSCQRCFQP
jgi:hypothetical protein